MGRTEKDLEAYLLAMGRQFQTSDDGTFVLVPTGEGRPPIGVRVDGPVVFTAELASVPQGDVAREARLFRKLLELNASDLLYCAYGLRGASIVLSSAHEIENLDLNEVQAILSDFDLAIARHLNDLASFSGAPAASR